MGVTSDIKRAFLQIAINEKDRCYLKFLWLDERGQEIIFQHRRVVFGVNCSPFLLGATIDHHLNKCLERSLISGSAYSKETITKLSKSLYVDNCVTSLPDRESLNKFIRESTAAMAEGQFELRGWESSNSPQNNADIQILGLRWNPNEDVLMVNQEQLQYECQDGVVTKRQLLSLAQRVFDPIGFTVPTTLIPKLLLQRLWENQISWDTPVEGEVAATFRKWLTELRYIQNIKIPRWISFGNDDTQDISVHTFCDASQSAYATVVFCRVQSKNKITVHLLAAKSRVAPLKRLTIPRLELMAATIGARLYTQVKENLTCKFDSFFWCDSSTVLSWIQRNEEWGTFVWNRIDEIRQLTAVDKWRHVPGAYNPADLPSRGCNAKRLLESRWWEGPAWLYQDKKEWPCEEPRFNEEEIYQERKRSVVTALMNIKNTDFWHLSYFSKFSKTVRMMAWIMRFLNNLKNPLSRRHTHLTVEELNNAETIVFKLIQQERFTDLQDKRIINLNPFYDDAGIIRLKTRLANREDTDNYRFPIVLPAKHPTVRSLVMDVHRNLCHVGTQGLLSHLREKYWILGGRHYIRSILAKCMICKRFSSKPCVVEAPPLPTDRVRDAVAFEVTGVDFAGPLYLKTGEKAWICLFTCAVYRAIHMELTLSLSTASFLQVLRRFVARRGRPKVLYSDNGTNFRGTDNAFAKLNWDQITQETSIQRIVWRFNPPSAPWWGGFYERLIGVVKQLLRRVLGRACLFYEELLTVICDCEAVVNSRPLTYISNDPHELRAITPAMFLRDQTNSDMPDCDELEGISLSRSVRHKQNLRYDLRRRFRLEYLGQLRFLTKSRPNSLTKVGDIVLIENDNSKRLKWPLGRVSEVMPGKDGLVRLVRVRTANGDLLRPVQRLLPLECDGDSAEESSMTSPTTAGPSKLQSEDSAGVIESRAPATTEKSVADSAGVIESRAPDRKTSITRSGRLSKLPKRFW